jgi:hypothetical protein
MIHDGPKTNDANVKQTESMIDDDVEMNDVFTTIEQGLQEEAVCDSVEMDTRDKTTDAYGHASTDSDDRINEGNIAIDQGRDFLIQDGVEMNDVSTIIEQEIQEDNVPPIQTNTLMEGGSVNIGEQTILLGGWTVMQELLTTVDLNNDEDQASNPEEVEYEDYGIGDTSDSSVKVRAKHVKKNIKKQVHHSF